MGRQKEPTALATALFPAGDSAAGAATGDRERGASVAELVPPRVLISYSHDSDEHRDRVVKLAKRLRDDGIEAIIDRDVQSPAQHWPAWCEIEIEKADFVLMVCTEIYHRRVRGEEEAGKGHGVLWEALLIRQHIYDAGSASGKFVPILFRDGSLDHVPVVVRGASIYGVETQEGYEALCRLLTAQPVVPVPPLGPRKELPPAYSTSQGLDREVFNRLKEHLTALKQLQELLPSGLYEESARTMTLHTLKKIGYNS